MELEMEKKRLLIDADFGIDDATAILVALKHCQVAALTVCHGNVNTDQGGKRDKEEGESWVIVLNAKMLLELVNYPQSVPIYPGAHDSLMAGMVPRPASWAGHGIDGFGGWTCSNDFKLQFPDLIQNARKNRTSESKHAALALVDLVTANPGSYTLLATGPLTNIALAIQLDPAFLSKLNEIYVMGGSIHSKGNSNRSAEYNFHVDPEAAHIVLHSAKILNQAAVVASAAADGSSSTSSSASAPILIKLATWESTVDHAFSWSFFDNLTSDSTTTSATLPASTTTQSKLSLFLKGYVQTARQIMESGSPSNNLGFLMCDFYSCAMAINESKCVIEHRDMDGIVECGGGQARGAVFYDWYEWAAQHVKNVRCAIKLNREFMEELLLSTFLQ